MKRAASYMHKEAQYVMLHNELLIQLWNFLSNEAWRQPTLELVMVSNGATACNNFIDQMELVRSFSRVFDKMPMHNWIDFHLSS